MIKFTLKCDEQHTFDCWFPGSDSLWRQLKMKLVDCPICGSLQITRPLSAPNLSTPKTRTRISEIEPVAAPAIDASSTPQIAGPATSQVATSPSGDVMRSMLREMQKVVERNFTNVGENFANEARKIHMGESDPENIYGKCTPDEQAELEEDGIEFGVMPWLPPDN